MKEKKTNYLYIINDYFNTTYEHEIAINSNFISYFDVNVPFNTKFIVKKMDRIRYYLVKDELNMYFSDIDICKLFEQIPNTLLLEYLNIFKSIYFSKVTRELDFIHFELNDLSNLITIFEGEIVNYNFPKDDLELKTKYDCSINLDDLNRLLCFIIHKDISADELTQSNNNNLKSTLMKYILKIEFILDLETIKGLKEEAKTKDNSFYKSYNIKRRLKELESMI